MTAIPSHYQELRYVVDTGLQGFEQCLDLAGYIPIVSSISGGIRIDYGMCEIVAGLAIGILGAAAALFTRDYKVFWWGMEIVVHGFANIARGGIECQKWINLLCLMSDYFAYTENSHLRLRYDTPIWIKI